MCKNLNLKTSLLNVFNCFGQFSCLGIIPMPSTYKVRKEKYVSKYGE